MSLVDWLISVNECPLVNTLRPRQNGQYFADDIFKYICLNEDMWISINVSVKFVLKGEISNIPALVQIMAWHQPGDKPLSEPMMTRLLTHIRAPPPQWVNNMRDDFSDAIQILFKFHYSCSPSGRVSFRVNLVCLCVRISISQEWHYIFISPKRQPPVTNGSPSQTPRRTRLWGLIVILKKLLNKQSNFMWSKTAW